MRAYLTTNEQLAEYNLIYDWLIIIIIIGYWVSFQQYVICMYVDKKFHVSSFIGLLHVVCSYVDTMYRYFCTVLYRWYYLVFGSFLLYYTVW